MVVNIIFSPCVGMAKITNGLSKKEPVQSLSSPRKKHPKLTKHSASLVDDERESSAAKKSLTNGFAKSNSLDVKEKNVEKKETLENTKQCVNHANGNYYRINPVRESFKKRRLTWAFG